MDILSKLGLHKLVRSRPETFIDVRILASMILVEASLGRVRVDFLIWGFGQAQRKEGGRTEFLVALCIWRRWQYREKLRGFPICGLQDVGTVVRKGDVENPGSLHKRCLIT